MKEFEYPIELITKCPFCGKENVVVVEDDDYLNYCTNNVLIQDAFPYLTPSERELIKTGICDDCWSGMFGEEEE